MTAAKSDKDIKLANPEKFTFQTRYLVSSEYKGLRATIVNIADFDADQIRQILTESLWFIDNGDI